MAITIAGAMVRDRTSSYIPGVRAQGSGLVPVPAPSGGSGGGSVTHGRDITAVNTGHTAYFDTGLGRNVVNGDLAVTPGVSSFSDFTTNGGTITKRWFQDSLIPDRDNVTFVACRWSGEMKGYYSGVHHPFTLNYCTIDTDAAGAQNIGVYFQDYTATRCRIGGSSDGCRADGGVTLTECFIRTKAQDSGDHNDGVAIEGAYAGCTIIRCNIDCRGVLGGGGPNAALACDSGAVGLQTWTDNWCAGGGYVLRLADNATYNVTGNDVLDGSWVFGPASRAIIPQSNVTWSNNRTVDGAGAFVSNIAIP